MLLWFEESTSKHGVLLENICMESQKRRNANKGDYKNIVEDKLL